MNTEKKMGLVGVWCLVCVLIVGMSVAVWAENAGTSLGEVCFRLLSFDDTISLNVVQFDLPSGAPSLFTFGVHWEGRTPQGELVYAMDGGGTAVYNPLADVFSLDVVLWNKTIFFGDQRICRLSAATDGTLTGPWQVTCSGLVPPRQGGVTYSGQGTLLRIDCAPDEPVAMSSGVAIPSTGMLAGQMP